MTFGEGQWESENFGLKSVSQLSDWLSVQCLQETNFWLCSLCNHINRNSQDSVTHSHVDIQWKRFRKHEGRKISACSLSTASLKAWQHWCMESSLKGRFLALSHSHAYELLPEKKMQRRKKNPSVSSKSHIMNLQQTEIKHYYLKSLKTFSLRNSGWVIAKCLHSRCLTRMYWLSPPPRSVSVINKNISFNCTEAVLTTVYHWQFGEREHLNEMYQHIWIESVLEIFGFQTGAK